MPDQMQSDRAERILADLADHLPPLTEEEVRAVLEADANGQLLDAADAFALAAGVSREEWLQRVVAHKAKKMAG